MHVMPLSAYRHMFPFAGCRSFSCSHPTIRIWKKWLPLWGQFWGHRKRPAGGYRACG